jgi:predicted ArsR family transcriptional regulator
MGQQTGASGPFLTPARGKSKPLGMGRSKGDDMNGQILSDYFKRCFWAVDGLWFMMLEKADSFDKALEIDRLVWEVLPKIQARKIKELFNLEGGNEDDLVKALEFKLEAEDFFSEIQCQDSSIEITIRKCPWLALLKKSKREHLAEKISDAICTIEYSVFAKEFLDGLEFQITSSRCSGSDVCTFLFRRP